MNELMRNVNDTVPIIKMERMLRDTGSKEHDRQCSEEEDGCRQRAWDDVVCCLCLRVGGSLCERGSSVGGVNGGVPICTHISVPLPSNL